MITPIAAVKAGFRNYAAFGGRATRAEYWWWMLFFTVGGLALSVIGGAIANATGLVAFASLSPRSYWQSCCPPSQSPPAACTTSANPAGGNWRGIPPGR